VFAAANGMSESRVPSASDLRAAFLACLRAHEACEAAVAHALRAQEGEAVDERVGALLDCADVCRTTARHIRYGSPLLRGTAGVAAELCERAAEACLALAHTPALPTWAEACRRSAACCRRLADIPLERAA
jgi:hypothetical protein